LVGAPGRAWLEAEVDALGPIDVTLPTSSSTALAGLLSGCIVADERSSVPGDQDPVWRRLAWRHAAGVNRADDVARPSDDAPPLLTRRPSTQYPS
jgi:hypothetical protein